jgi:hypothetical protein
MKHALIACCCLASSLQAFEVHEWGTFTVLAGSHGNQVSWYLPHGDIARLPDFVHPGIFGKARAARIRMETPVIYFYPKERMKVAVEAAFANGSITETYPYSIGRMTGIDPASGMIMKPGKWTGTLHPPDDRNALSHIPVIKASSHEEPYGAAREVPDAWIFESDVREIPGLKNPPHFPEMEKFIFYRGVGNAHLPVSVSMKGNQVTFASQARSGIGLRVRGDKAAWVEIPDTTSQPAQDARSIIDLPDASRPLDEVEDELGVAWKSALAEDGLTPAEASAMVETWRKTWFREEGDRILILLPRQTIDNMLPLKVTPEPVKTERVFVARIEMISPDREQALAKLMKSDGTPTAADIDAYHQLGLGRFASGAADIALERLAFGMREKFHHLKNAAEAHPRELSLK